MKRFFVFSVVCTFTWAFCALAQTPQQLEMLKGKGLLKEPVKHEGVYKDEKTGKWVIPQNDGKVKIRLEDGQDIPVPMPKTDAELMQSRRGPNIKIMSQMTEEERKNYMEYVVQDRIFLSVEDVKVMDSGLGTKICQMNLKVVNNTPRLLKRLLVNFKWGKTYIPAEFTNVPIVRHVQEQTALSGVVCDDVLKGVQFDIVSCSMEGLSEEQCKMRIAKQ